MPRGPHEYQFSDDGHATACVAITRVHSCLTANALTRLFDLADGGAHKALKLVVNDEVVELVMEREDLAVLRARVSQHDDKGGNALRANIFNDEVWKPALAAAGVIPMREKGKRWKASRKDGFHVLPHTFASVILEAGESVVTLARWLGHSSPTITLDCYAHFMPEAGGKGRAAVDALLGLVSEYIPDNLAWA